MRKVRFDKPVFANGVAVFEAGKDYEATPETEKWVRRGAGRLVEVDDAPPTTKKGKKGRKNGEGAA